jgi:hypothetical protein
VLGEDLADVRVAPRQDQPGQDHRLLPARLERGLRQVHQIRHPVRRVRGQYGQLAVPGAQVEVAGRRRQTQMRRHAHLARPEASSLLGVDGLVGAEHRARRRQRRAFAADRVPLESHLALEVIQGLGLDALGEDPPHVPLAGGQEAAAGGAQALHALGRLGAHPRGQELAPFGVGLVVLLGRAGVRRLRQEGVPRRDLLRQRRLLALERVSAGLLGHDLTLRLALGDERRGGRARDGVLGQSDRRGGPRGGLVFLFFHRRY